MKNPFEQCDILGYKMKDIEKMKSGGLKFGNIESTKICKTPDYKYIKIYDYMKDDLYDKKIQKIYEITLTLSDLMPQCVPKISKKSNINERLSILMEKVDGIKLSKLIKRKDLDAENTLKVINSLLRTVNCMHENGFIHGDLHDKNIFVDVDKEYNIILIDFDDAEDINSLCEDCRTIKKNKDFSRLKYCIAQLIFSQMPNVSSEKIIDALRDYNATKVIEYDTNPDLAKNLYRKFENM